MPDIGCLLCRRHFYEEPELNPRANSRARVAEGSSDAEETGVAREPESFASATSMLVTPDAWMHVAHVTASAFPHL